MASKHDQVLLEILKDEQNVTNFLDTFFGFMYRCTDFYLDSTAEQKLGFPPGVAEDLVLKVFKKWKNKDNGDRVTGSQMVTDFEIPEVVQEVQVESSENLESAKETSKSYVTPVQLSDSYNGAVREDYTWSQSINDLDVLINIPSYIRSAKDLRVEITSTTIRVEATTKILGGNKDLVKYSKPNCENSQWTIIFDKELSFKTQKEESVWCFVPGKFINIHLEKTSERWWEALMKGEPNIELSKIDCSRPIDDLGVNEQMKVHELMWNHQQKLLGKPTSDQINMEKVLKKAWDVEGSPFKGTEYDPGVLKFN